MPLRGRCSARKLNSPASASALAAFLAFLAALRAAFSSGVSASPSSDYGEWAVIASGGEKTHVFLDGKGDA